MKRKTRTSIFDNFTLPLLKDAVGWIMTRILIPFILGGAAVFCTEEIRYHDVISIDSISTIIDTYLVQTTLVDPDILELESPQEQIERIGSLMEEQNALSSELRSALISVGYAADEINAMDADGLVAALSDYSGRLTQLQAENARLSEDYQTLATEYAALEAGPQVEFSAPSLSIHGEGMDTTLKDFVAVVNGKNYYQEAFLNTYLLDEPLSVEDGVLYYGDSSSERVKAVTDALLHDNDRFEIQEGTSEYVLGTKECTYGLVNMQWADGCSEIYIECDGQYSGMEFGLGHVNDSGGGDKTLNIYCLNADGEYELAYTQELRADMAYQEGISVDILNTQTVKIEFLGSYGGVRYGMTDIYLVR